MQNFRNIEDLEQFELLVTNHPEFESLKDKTQVFNKRKTEDVKSRGVHCIDVAEISSAICTAVIPVKVK